ncbi:MAG: L-threonylcarbamoyladenylate synthase [Desulforhopalus sp.]
MFRKRHVLTIDSSSLSLAVRILQQGGVVAFPTETSYGLAADPYCCAAVKKVFEVKKRSLEKPLLLLIGDVAFLDGLVESIPHQYPPLIKKYWPGPLTLIFAAQKGLCQLVTGMGGTVGIRISSHPVAQQLVRQFGRPITATSANISGTEPAESAAEVAEMFGDAIDCIVDGGDAGAGNCSTILTVIENQLTVVRQGLIDPGLAAKDTRS